MNYKSVGLLAMTVFAALFMLFWETDDESFVWYMAGICGFILLIWLGIIILRLWFWKYAKYVVVTNEGIWLMWHSLF
ncbi:MAG: hypothetical protein NC350_00615 [Corallococcus sp.]|nr:hypothetical protein [Corallococcus sp.]